MITVIGGSGFIGTRLCKNLADRQIAFEIVDLRKSGRFPEKTKIADIRNLDALRKAVTGDTIINLAAVHRDDVRDKSEYYTTNVDGTRNVCDVAAEKGIRRIVFTSTVAVYGFAEPDTGEDGAINPFNDYGKSKFNGEEVLRAWHKDASDNRDLVIVRPTVVFGEGNRGNVYNLLKQIASGRFMMVGNGKNRKSMAYVGNVAAFLETAAERGDGYQLYNYVDKPDFDMNKLVAKVRKQLSAKKGVGARLPYWFGLLLGYVADGVASITGKSLPVSSIRVKKFCATTAFASNASALDGFTAPFPMGDALDRTLDAEFINPDPNREIFFTE
ncbi:NAD(P)-dependent oxidoreductase [Roseivivax sp. THAF197b]|uniref:NAD-dependent epimerase/dehydratase family protein n=1 Tax=Roseivivax sp. THAF197b TaxID=2588299 RepID=UPI0012697220|nr:NAD-dependent epimerase/dehydratase family protein [Roseivivax sp. THAF197b]QFS84840.1 3 beta-hydroxysteroid dehydrogenase/Delta 5-->4-isomerase [Roseivivax sp. THAF197b]